MRGSEGRRCPDTAPVRVGFPCNRTALIRIQERALMSTEGTAPSPTLQPLWNVCSPCHPNLSLAAPELFPRHHFSSFSSQTGGEDIPYRRVSPLTQLWLPSRQAGPCGSAATPWLLTVAAA